MSESKCIILAASDFNQKELKKRKNDFLIVADAGYINFKKIRNLTNNDIDLLIGDFDSIDEIPDGVEVKRLNPIKDDTDVLDAIKYALSLGYRNFELYGCIGGRIEHSLANISALSFINKNKAKAKIINGNQIIELLCDETKEFNKEFKGYISLFSLSEESLININGLKYELNNHLLTNDFPLGIDNEFVGKDSRIEVVKGKILIIYYSN